MEKHIKLFLEFLQDDKKLSDNTLQSYKRDIEQYRDYIQENRINYLKVDGEDLQEYLKKWPNRWNTITKGRKKGTKCINIKRSRVTFRTTKRCWLKRN